jgi:molybdate transport system substrate-binding protein
MSSAPVLLSITVMANFLLIANDALAAELTVLSPQAMTPALSELIPQFERSSGNKVTIFYASASTHFRSIKEGTNADLAILSREQINQLQDDEKIIKDSVTPIAKADIGVIVRKGAAKPDVSRVRTLKQTLMRAESIAVGDPEKSASGAYFAALIQRLQIADAIRPKIKTFPSVSTALQAVTNGEADIGIGVVSTANGPDTELVDVLPAQAKRTNSYVAGILAGSHQGRAAKDLISFISSSTALAVMKSKGFAAP